MLKLNTRIYSAIRQSKDSGYCTPILSTVDAFATVQAAPPDSEHQAPRLPAYRMSSPKELTHKIYLKIALGISPHMCQSFFFSSPCCNDHKIVS